MKNIKIIILTISIVLTIQGCSTKSKNNDSLGHKTYPKKEISPQKYKTYPKKEISPQKYKTIDHFKYLQGMEYDFSKDNYASMVQRANKFSDSNLEVYLNSNDPTSIEKMERAAKKLKDKKLYYKIRRLSN